MKEKITIKGIAEICIRRADGTIREKFTVKNQTMNAALATFSGLVFNTGSYTAFLYLAVGSSNTAVAPTQTALGAEITTNGLARAGGTKSQVTTSQTNDTAQITHTWTATGSLSIEEVGYFNASSAGIMGGRLLTGTKALSTGETFTVTYKIIFS